MNITSILLLLFSFVFLSLLCVGYVLPALWLVFASGYYAWEVSRWLSERRGR